MTNKINVMRRNPVNDQNLNGFVKDKMNGTTGRSVRRQRNLGLRLKGKRNECPNTANTEMHLCAFERWALTQSCRRCKITTCEPISTIVYQIKIDFWRIERWRLRRLHSSSTLTNTDSRSNLRTWRAIDLIGFFEKGTKASYELSTNWAISFHLSYT